MAFPRGSQVPSESGGVQQRFDRKQIPVDHQSRGRHWEQEEATAIGEKGGRSLTQKAIKGEGKQGSGGGEPEFGLVPCSKS